MEHAALVLEGGALRCVYTAGILDVFLDNGLDFEYTIGVSAGTLCGLNYITGARGRTADINLGYCDDPRYISLLNRFRYDGVFNIDYLFEEPAGRWALFSPEGYDNLAHRYVIGATSCTSGRLALFNKPPSARLIPPLKASCAMPLTSKKIKIGDDFYLDGGISDSVPYQAAMDAGYRKIVVVKTQDRLYRKKPLGRAARLAYRAFYSRYPNLYEALVTRPARYNAQMEEIEKLGQSGRLFVIQPEAPVQVSHAEKDKGKLRALYESALGQSARLLPALREYLAGP